MKLGVINSFLIVCFDNGFKSCQVREYLQNSCKILCNDYKTTFRNNALNLQSITRQNLPIIFHAVRWTKHFLDWVSADYIDYYMQGSGKLDKYGFSGACLLCIHRG